MKTILITGGCGFIGANFIRYLLEEVKFSGKIVNVDKLTYAGNPENLADIAQRYPAQYHFARVDICERQALGEVFQQHQPQIIVHFAAESHVDRSIVWPDAFVQTNIVGTYNLLELVRAAGEKVSLFHHVSTDEVFGSLDNPKEYFTESTPYHPNSPYSASKAAADHLVRAFSHTYGLPVTVSNCSNNYGPYHFPEKLIPLMILNALEFKPLPVYGDGRQVRDWLYVLDHCKAIWRIIESGRRGETYNLGGGAELENIAVVKMICQLVDELVGLDRRGPRENLIAFVKDRPGHDRRYAIDSSKAQRELNWRAEESFATGLRKTVQWYLDNMDWVTRLRSGE